jgi:hypothetical protein
MRTAATTTVYTDSATTVDISTRRSDRNLFLRYNLVMRAFPIDAWLFVVGSFVCLFVCLFTIWLCWFTPFMAGTGVSPWTRGLQTLWPTPSLASTLFVVSHEWTSPFTTQSWA